MSDDLILVTDELKAAIKLAGANKLTRWQTAMELGMSDQEFRTLMIVHPELNDDYERGKLEEIKRHYSSMRSIATNPRHIQHFQAAKYMYELLTGHSTGPSTQINIQNVHQSQNEKMKEVLDVEVIEAIKNDARSKS